MVLVSWESMWTVALDSTGNHCQGWGGRGSAIRRGTGATPAPRREGYTTHPTRHQTETTETRADTERTLPTKLDRHQPERFVTRRDESEIGATEQVRWQGCEL